MARQQAAQKLGFYPAPPEAVAGILTHLALSDQTDKPVVLLDPCAGQGAAVKQLAAGLAIPESQVYCVELDAERAGKVREAMPEAHVLGPASYLGVGITPSSFGLIYCNPPFDSELGGGRREELVFARQATKHLAIGGVLVLVFPINAIAGQRNFCSFLDAHYRDVAVYRFPDEHRKYRECVLFGIKRALPMPEDRLSEVGTLHRMYWHWGGFNRAPGDLPELGQVQPSQWQSGQPSAELELDPRTYNVPPSRSLPARFQKIGYTEEELIQVIEASPHKQRLSSATAKPPKRPPLPLSKGHVAMLLASGMLDGAVCCQGEPLHVIRGVATKQEVFNEEASTVEIDEEDGTARIKEVYSERIQLSVRAVDEFGELNTFTDDGIGESSATGRPADSPPPDEALRDTELSADYDLDLAAKLARITVANGATPAEEAQAQARLAAMKKISADAAEVA